MKLSKLTLAAACTFAMASVAEAGPAYVLQDTYWGGLDTYYAYSPSAAHGDSIGGTPFTVDSAEVTRSGSTLTVKINTAYAGHSGLDSTFYGDLLLNKTWRAANVTTPGLLSNWQYGASGNGTNAGTVNSQSVWNNTTYRNNLIAGTNTTNKLGNIWQPGDWSYAVANGPSGLGLYRITNANIVLAQVGACNNSWPIDGACGWFYRAGEAVRVQNLTAADLVSNLASMTVVADKSITYTFNDNGLLGNDFALSWAMTCANDVIQGQVNVPEPGTLALVGVAALGMGVAARRRRKAG